MSVEKLSDQIYAVGGGSAAVVFAKSGSHTNLSSKETNLLAGDKWLYWGEDNLYPQNFAEKLKKTGVAIGGLEVLTSAHFGSGFKIYQQIESEKGVELRERITSSFPELHDFFQRTKFNIMMSEIISDYETWRWAAPEYLLSPNYENIISVKRLKVADGRFEKPDKKGIIRHIGFNTDWLNYDKENTVSVPCFGAHVPIEEIKAYCKKRYIRKFTIPIIDSLLIEKTYPAVGWHSSFKNGWVDVVLSLPEFKKAMFKQQLNIKYLIHVADDYFYHMYKDMWSNFTSEKKIELRDQLIEAIDDKLKGNEAGGRSLTSPFFRDRDTGQEIKGIQIEPIKQEQSNGDFLMDGSAANYEILTPMGVDPCLINGGTFGGKSLSGSGSDKREAWTILCAKFPIKQARTLQVFENIKIWNKWDSTLCGKFPTTNLTTLDKNPSGQVEIVN